MKTQYKVAAQFNVTGRTVTRNAKAVTSEEFAKGKLNLNEQSGLFVNPKNQISNMKKILSMPFVAYKWITWRLSWYCRKLKEKRNINKYFK